MGRPGPRTTPRYSEHFKATAVRLSQLPGVAVQDVAESLYIHPFMLSRWRKQAREGLIMGKGVKLDKDVAVELKALRKLKKEHEQLKMEHDLLKKAIAFTSARRAISSPSSSTVKARICEAVTRPTMRFVPVKDMEQQTVLALHRARQGFVVERTAQANQMRGLLYELGIVIPKGIRYVDKQLPEILEDAENGLPEISRSLFARLFEHFRALGNQVKELESQIKAWHKQSAASERIEAIPGIGALTASALVASIGDAKTFKSGRQLAAWLGLVPRQDSSGGKEKLLGISKRGDVYLRTLLIHGARAVLFHRMRQVEYKDGWLMKLRARRNPNVAAVALANKNARVVWALLAHGREYSAAPIAAVA